MRARAAAVVVLVCFLVLVVSACGGEESGGLGDQDASSVAPVGDDTDGSAPDSERLQVAHADWVTQANALCFDDIETAETKVFAKIEELNELAAAATLEEIGAQTSALIFEVAELGAESTMRFEALGSPPLHAERYEQALKDSREIEAWMREMAELAPEVFNEIAETGDESVIDEALAPGEELTASVEEHWRALGLDECLAQTAILAGAISGSP